MVCVCACVASVAAVLPGLAGAARPRAPALAPADTVVDGPSSEIRSLNGLSVSRDGSGALVYTKTVGAVAHVFLSRLAGGTFQAPVQVDAGLVGPSSQPVVAAGQNGLVLVAFVNAGALYVAQALSAASPLSAPAPLFTGAANPSISISNFGKAYLAFTNTAGAGGGDVRAAYFFQGQWALEASPLDAVAGDAAGVGTGRPDVAASGDGVGIVAWGEAGHIFTRRVTATMPSTVTEQADPPSLDGWSETSAGLPSIGTGGDSTFGAVAFQETLSNGSVTQSRVLVNRLQASMFAGASAVDGASTGGPEGADQPQMTITEYGAGFITSETDGTHELFATPLGQGENRGSVERVDSLVNADAADAVPATAGLTSNLIAWQQTPGVAGPAEIRVRYAADGADLGDEQVVSSPSLGRPMPTTGSWPPATWPATPSWPGSRAAARARRSSPHSCSRPPGASCPPTASATSPPRLRRCTGHPRRGVGRAHVRAPYRRRAGGPDHRHPNGRARTADQRPPQLSHQRHQPGRRDHQRPGGDGVRRHRWRPAPRGS